MEALLGSGSDSLGMVIAFDTGSNPVIGKIYTDHFDYCQLYG